MQILPQKLEQLLSKARASGLIILRGDQAVYSAGGLSDMAIDALRDALQRYWPQGQQHEFNRTVGLRLDGRYYLIFSKYLPQSGDLLGLIFPTSGSGQIFGHPLGSNATKKRIGFLPEGPYFYEHLNGMELLSFYCTLFGMGGSRLAGRVEELLHLVGMWDRRFIRVRDYSRGMRQRIGAAQSMINDPDLLFLDELTSGLDPIGAMEMHRLILNLRDEGKTVFLCSHLLKDMEPLCDRVIILNQGEVCETGRVDELLRIQDEYRLLLSNVSEELIQQLQAAEIATEVAEGGRLTAFFGDQSAALDVAQQAAAAGATIEDLGAHQRTLEEVFIDAVGGNE